MRATSVRFNLQVFLAGRRWYDVTLEKLVIVGGWLAFIRVLDLVMVRTH